MNVLSFINLVIFMIARWEYWLFHEPNTQYRSLASDLHNATKESVLRSRLEGFATYYTILRIEGSLEKMFDVVRLHGCVFPNKSPQTPNGDDGILPMCLRRLSNLQNRVGLRVQRSVRTFSIVDE